MIVVILIAAFVAGGLAAYATFRCPSADVARLTQAHLEADRHWRQCIERSMADAECMEGK